MQTSWNPISGCWLWFLLAAMSISTHSKAQQTPTTTRVGPVSEGLNPSAVYPKSGRSLGDFPKGAEDLLPDRIHQGWEFRAEGQTKWESVSLPGTFESHQGVGFDGVGWYRKKFPRILTEGSGKPAKRLVLRFSGVATRATLWCDGQQVAEHLGGWTPFECDITDFVLRHREGQRTPEGATEDCEVILKVDELVGHNSQGFLPVFAPHFGGIWQPIEAYYVDPVWIDTKELFVWGEPSTKTLRFVIPLQGSDLGAIQGMIDPSQGYRVCLRHRIDAFGEKSLSKDERWNEHWVELSRDQVEELRVEGKVVLQGSVSVPQPVLWSPHRPSLYEVQVGFESFASREQNVNQESSKGQEARSWIDLVSTYAGFREVRAEGSRLLLNGEPLRVRGILNWGYAPPSVAPSLDPEHWRKELQLVKDYGFNLMKFCLWVPPKGYLEMADRMGVLVWIEYPTWHSRWSLDALPTLEREFEEFFCYDRNHPSVVLRSLTCETGPSADITVIRKLYDRCHERIPGSIVEDDSSWIQWNRVHDFYDDHPYGNNHTWVPTLKRLKGYIDEHGVKPLVLGEAIAADSWLPPGSLDAIAPSGDQARLQGVKRSVGAQEWIEPFWFPLSYRANSSWAIDRKQDMGVQAVTRLHEDSLKYAWLMRKYQIETFVREVPDAGYVVSVIRDFPFASMGLMDFQGRPKWAPSDWAWHGSRLLMLRTDQDRRSFWADEAFSAQVLVDRLAEDLKQNAWVRWTWRCGSVSVTKELALPKRASNVNQVNEDRSFIEPYEVLKLDERVPMPASHTEAGVASWTLGVELFERLGDGQERLIAQNHWDLWQVDSPQRGLAASKLEKSSSKLYLHESCSEQQVKNIKSLANVLGRDVSEAPQVQSSDAEGIWIAQRVDESILDYLEQGGSVLLIPDGQKGSLPIAEHWFLRGGPIVSADGYWDRFHRMLVDLQHFDLAGPVVPDVQWLEQLTPIAMLWDNHDIATVMTHGLLFATKVGAGVMLVDTLNHGDGRGAAGAKLFDEVLRWLEVRPAQSVKAMGRETIEGIRYKLRERTLNLTDRVWMFQPDPKNQGLELGWQGRTLTDDNPGGWREIAIGKHWEGLGYESLDGWAWYRTELTLPEDWPAGRCYLQIDGADDYIEVFVDGELIGTAGDRQQRKTAFEQRVSFPISGAVSPGEKVSIAVRVEDWQGAGGLFRPIRLSTTELREVKPILR
jgi:hypothetical protein